MNCRLRRQNGSIWYYLVHDNFFEFGLDRGTIIYIKQKVDVRLTKATVEVFCGGNRICSHPRLYGRFNQYSTIQEHMPPEHQKYVQWNGERFIHWAGKVGSNTQVAVKPFSAATK